MSAFFAFLHHLAAFALVASLVVEFVVIRDEMNARIARRLALADLECFASRKAPHSIFRTAHSSPSWLCSLPYLRWRRHPDPAQVLAVRRVLHVELVGVVLILYFAASIWR